MPVQIRPWTPKTMLNMSRFVTETKTKKGRKRIELLKCSRAQTYRPRCWVQVLTATPSQSVRESVHSDLADQSKGERYGICY